MRALSTSGLSRKIGILSTAVVALTMTTMYGMPTAYANTATSVSKVMYGAETQTEYAVASYDVFFDTSASGALTQGQGTISMSFPTGTVLPSAASDYLVNGQAVTQTPVITNGSPTDTVVITVPVNVNASDLVDVRINGVTNPAANSSYPSSDTVVSTSADTVPTGPASGMELDVFPASAQLTKVGVAAGSDRGAAITGWEYEWVDSDKADLTAGSGTITLTAPAGTKYSSNPANYMLVVDSNSIYFPQSDVSVSPSGNTVTLTVPQTIPKSAGMDLMVDNVINPPAGTYPSSDFTVVTSADSTAVASAIADGNSTQSWTFAPAITIDSLLVNGKPAPTSLEANVQYNDTYGYLDLLFQDTSGNVDLSNIGITPNDTIEAKFTLPFSYAPVTGGATGDMLNWSASPQSNGTTIIDVTGKPMQTSYSANTSATTADITYKSALEFGWDDMSSLQTQLGSSFTTDKTALQNTFLSSNAGVTNMMTYDPTTHHFSFELDAPHYASDGKTVNQGWFNAFIPDSTLANVWGMTASNITTGSILAKMNDSSTGSATVTPQVTQVNGGIMLEYSGFAYSAENVTLEPNPMSPPVGLQHQSVTQTGWTESWQPVSGAASYNVYVNGTKVANVAGTSCQVANQAGGQTYSVTVRAVDSTGVETGASAADSVQTVAPAVTSTNDGFTSVVNSYQFDSTGGSVSATSGSSGLSLFVPKGAFKSPVQVKLTAGLLSHLGAPIPAGQKAVAAFGVNFPANATPSKPITFTITNPNIAAGDAVYKVSGGKLIPVSGATVTNGKAVITFTSDPDFVVLAPTAKTVPGATSPETGLPFDRTALEGGLLSIAGLALLLVSRRKKHQQ